MVVVPGDATCKKDNKNKKQYNGMKSCTYFVTFVKRTQTSNHIDRQTSPLERRSNGMWIGRILTR